MKGTHSFRQPTLAIGAILLAGLAQYAHLYRQADATALALFAVALAAWIIALRLAPIAVTTRLDETSAAPSPTRRWSKGWIASAAILALLTFLSSSGNAFTSDNVLAWGASIVAFLYAFWEPEKNWNDWGVWLRERIAAARAIRLTPRAWVLAGIVLVAIFSCYHNLDGVPAEMDSDHAEKLLDVNDLVTHDWRPIFFTRNTGREPLQFYLTAAFIGLTGHPLDHMSLKLITALMGVLVVPLTFLFARELFDDDVALLAAAFIAISRWEMTIARMGLRFPFAPVLVVPAMFFLFRALKHQRRNDFLMTGLWLGIGLYGYSAFRVVPILVALFLALWLITHRSSWHAARALAINSALMFALMVVVLMPLARYATEFPGDFWYRTWTRLLDVEQPLTDHPATILAGNLVNAALMFNWVGDMAWPNSVPGDPALDYVAGGLFVLGVAYALYRLTIAREKAYAFVLLGVGTMLLPTALSLAFPNENPSIVRAGGAIPFVFILVALPLAYAARALRQSLNDSMWSKVAGIGVIVFLLLVCARTNYLRYFRDFDQTYRRLAWNSSEVASVIRGFAESVGDVEHAWILLYPHWVDTRNVAIHLQRLDWEQTLPQAEDARAHARDGANKLYILNLNDHANLARLKEIFPNAQTRIFRARTPGHDFYALYVPGSIAPPEPLGSQ